MPSWRDRLSVDRRTPDQQEAAALRLQLLQNQIANVPLQQEAKQAQLTRASATEAKSRYDLNKQIETDRQKTAFYNGLAELESNLNKMDAPIGTQKHAEAFATYAHEFPLARASADVDRTLQLHAKVADDQAAFTNRLRELSPPPEQVSQRYSKLQGSIIAHQEGSKKEEVANRKAGKAGVLYTKAPELHSNQIEAASLERLFPQLVAPSAQPSVQPQQPAAPTEGQLVAPAATPATTPATTTVAAATTPAPVKQFKYNPQTGTLEE